MSFYYTVAGLAAGASYATQATANTEDATLVLRQTLRNCDVWGISCNGRATSATTISGISYIVRRWTTVGTGGTAVVPNPVRIGTVASTVCADKASAVTPGTVSGVIVKALGCGKAGPGGWVARDQDDCLTLEAGSADEFIVYSLAGEASLPHYVSATIGE